MCVGPHVPLWLYSHTLAGGRIPSAPSQLPKKGTLEFDYVSTTRPTKRAVPLTDTTFHHMVVSTRLEELIEMMSMEIGSVSPEVAWQATEWQAVVETQDTRYMKDAKEGDAERDDADSVDWDDNSDDGEVSHMPSAPSITWFVFACSHRVNGRGCICYGVGRR